MAITRFPPNTVHLGGQLTIVNDLAAGETVTPGMLVERYSDSGTPKFRKASSAAGDVSQLIALDQHMLNRTVDQAYASGDLIEVGAAVKGSTWWMLIASGENLAAGAQLESAGNGLLRAQNSGKPLFVALEDTDNSAGPSTMRIKVEAL